MARHGFAGENGFKLTTIAGFVLISRSGCSTVALTAVSDARTANNRRNLLIALKSDIF
jgi:hypothetical protein